MPRQQRAGADRPEGTDMTTTVQTTDRRQRTAIGAAGLGAVLAFAGAALSFPDPLGGSGTAAEAARRLDETAVDRAVLLVGVYVLLATVVVAALTAALPQRSAARLVVPALGVAHLLDRKSTRLNSSHANISYAVFCLK